MTTKQTIIRHLKGIVAALEKEEEPKELKLMGKMVKVCTDEEIKQAWLEIKNINNAIPVDIGSYYDVLKGEADRRNIVLDI